MDWLLHFVLGQFVLFVLLVGTYYPAKINERFCSPRYAGQARNANGIGAEAAFVCGSFVRFSLRIDTASKEIIEAKFQTNGCGFMIAAADVLVEEITGQGLTDLHGLESNEMLAMIEEKLGAFPQHRRHCAEVCVDALHAAFADHRAFQLEEYTGESPLICTCFGISEETVVNCIAEGRIETVEEVTVSCRAGGGCGSCKMLIQELIDIRNLR